MRAVIVFIRQLIFSTLFIFWDTCCLLAHLISQRNTVFDCKSIFIFIYRNYLRLFCSTDQGSVSRSHGHGTDFINEGLDCVASLMFDLSPWRHIRIAKQVGLVKRINCIMQPLTVRQTKASPASLSYTQKTHTYTSIYCCFSGSREQVTGYMAYALTLNYLRGVSSPHTYQ